MVNHSAKVKIAMASAGTEMDFLKFVPIPVMVTVIFQFGRNFKQNFITYPHILPPPSVTTGRITRDTKVTLLPTIGYLHAKWYLSTLLPRDGQ